MANPESGFSLTFKINDPKGIENLVTLRSESNELPDVSALLEDKDTLVDQMLANGWSPTGSNRAQSSNNDSGGNSNGGGRGSTYGGGNRNSNRSNNNNNGGGAENCRCGVPGVRKNGNNPKTGPWSAIMCKNRNCDPLFD